MLFLIIGVFHYFFNPFPKQKLKKKSKKFAKKRERVHRPRVYVYRLELTIHAIGLVRKCGPAKAYKPKCIFGRIWALSGVKDFNTAIGHTFFDTAIGQAYSLNTDIRERSSMVYESFIKHGTYRRESLLR